MDDLDFGIKDVAFETKVLNEYGTFHQIANRSMEAPSSAYLHCDLLDKTILTTIILRVKSSHIKMYEHLHRHVCEDGRFLTLNQSPKRVLKKMT